ncbi:uncharacterized protein [Oscarella lobularis]|uniref:uncharacterized protein isoform X2 n=1 Tax=Oscarella lobularis TaxID=121494 RepID=UPI003313FFCF
MTVKAACVIVGFLLLHQASALDVEKVREAIGVLLHKTMRATSFIRIPRESRNESEQNGDHSPDYDKIHYSLGPIGACSRPAISHCSFSSSLTIPEYYARLFRQSASPQMTTLYNHFRSITNSECADGIMSMICPYAVIPQCQSDAQVKFIVPDFETICTKGVSKCPNPGALEMAMCKNDGQLAEKIQSGAKTEETLTGKSFALTKCRVPSISGCSNMLPSPDWLAAEREAYFNSSLDSYVDTLSDGNEECKTKLYSFLCAFPTCNTNQTAVIGYRTQASCEDAFACVPSSKRSLISTPCSNFAGLDKPSPNYEPNKPKPSPSHGGPSKSLAWWACLCIAIGCVIGVVLLVGTIVSVRKRIRSRRLARYQEMESTT